MAHYMTTDANKEVQLSSYIHGYHVSTALIYMAIMLATNGISQHIFVTQQISH